MGRIAAENPKVSAWYLGGHSLGGAMAASYLHDHLEAYRGLALLGSYSTVDLTASSSFKTATIYGSEDQVLNRSNYQENLKNLPANNVETIIAGGNHDVRPPLTEEVFVGFSLVAVIEIVLRLGLAAEGFAVLDLLNVLKTAGDAFVAVAVKGIKAE